MIVNGAAVVSWIIVAVNTLKLPRPGDNNRKLNGSIAAIHPFCNFVLRFLFFLFYIAYIRIWTQGEYGNSETGE